MPASDIVVSLSKLHPDDAAQLGSLITNTHALVHLKGQTPEPALVVLPEIFSVFFDDHHIARLYANLQKQISSLDPKTGIEAAKTFSKTLFHLPLDPKATVQLIDAYQKLGSKLVSVQVASTSIKLPITSHKFYTQGDANLINTLKAALINLLSDSLIHPTLHLNITRSSYVGIVQQIDPPPQISVQVNMTKPIAKSDPWLSISVVHGFDTPIHQQGQIAAKYLVDQFGNLVGSTQYLQLMEYYFKQLELKSRKLTKSKKIQLSQTDLKHLYDIACQIKRKLFFDQQFTIYKSTKGWHLLTSKPAANSSPTTQPLPSTPVITTATPLISTGLVTTSPDPHHNQVVYLKDPTVLDFLSNLKAKIILTNVSWLSKEVHELLSRHRIPVIGSLSIPVPTHQSLAFDTLSGDIYKHTSITTHKPKIPGNLEVYIDASSGDLLSNLILTHCNGVGYIDLAASLLHVGRHPKSANTSNLLKHHFTSRLQFFRQKLGDRKTIVHLDSLDSNFFKTLKTGYHYETSDAPNPALSLRGAQRFLSDDNFLSIYTTCYKKADSSQIAFPLTRSVNEAKSLLKKLEQNGVSPSNSQIFFTIMTPENLFNIHVYNKMPFSGLIFDLDTFWQLSTSSDGLSDNISPHSDHYLSFFKNITPLLNSINQPLYLKSAKIMDPSIIDKFHPQGIIISPPNFHHQLDLLTTH